MEVMKFIFSNVFTFFGTVLLIYVVGEAINTAAKGFRSNKKEHDDNGTD